jgi:hypothetical protein
MIYFLFELCVIFSPVEAFVYKVIGTKCVFFAKNFMACNFL